MKTTTKSITAAGLLLSGLTDEAIARHLGVASRSVQRRIAALMADLGAHSRFRAGVPAALRPERTSPIFQPPRTPGEGN